MDTRPFGKSGSFLAAAAAAAMAHRASPVRNGSTTGSLTGAVTGGSGVPPVSSAWQQHAVSPLEDLDLPRAHSSISQQHRSPVSTGFAGCIGGAGRGGMALQQDFGMPTWGGNQAGAWLPANAAPAPQAWGRMVSGDDPSGSLTGKSIGGGFGSGSGVGGAGPSWGSLEPFRGVTLPPATTVPAGYSNQQQADCGQLAESGQGGFGQCSAQDQDQAAGGAAGWAPCGSQNSSGRLAAAVTTAKRAGMTLTTSPCWRSSCRTTLGDWMRHSCRMAGWRTRVWVPALAEGPFSTTRHGPRS